MAKKKEVARANYGMETIIDLHNCDTSKFNRKDLKKFFIEVTKIIKAERCKLCWWDDHGLPEEEKQTLPHLVGTTAVQFISTSNVIIHTLDILENAYINIFSCSVFEPEEVLEYCKNYFSGDVVTFQTVERK